MTGRSVQTPLAVVMWAAGCWPVGRWLILRSRFVPEQEWLLLAPLTALALVATRRPRMEPAVSVSRWVPALLFMLAYVGGYRYLPMTLRAFLAVGALLFVPGP